MFEPEAGTLVTRSEASALIGHKVLFRSLRLSAKASYILQFFSAFRVFLSNNLLSLGYKANMSSNDAKSIKTTKSAKPSEIKISSTF